MWNLTVDGEHEYFANGILVSNCDAVLYAYRESLHWLHEPKATEPAPGTPEWFAREEAEMEEHAEAEERAKIQEQEESWG